MHGIECETIRNGALTHRRVGVVQKTFGQHRRIWSRRTWLHNGNCIPKMPTNAVNNKGLCGDKSCAESPVLKGRQTTKEKYDK